MQKSENNYLNGRYITLFYTCGIFFLLLFSMMPLDFYPYELTGPILICGIIICLLLIGFFFLSFLNHKNNKNANIKISIVIICLILILIISVIKHGIEIWTIYVANLILLFLLLKNLLTEKILNLNIIRKIVACVVVIEICKLIFKIISVNPIFFGEMGYSNNNIIAMFLVASLLLLLQSNEVKIHHSLLLFLFFGLIIYYLDSRTGLIGLICGLIMIFIFEINKSFKTNKKFIIWLIMIVTVMLVGFFRLNSVKTESTEGRLIIWKNSLNIIRNQPILGYGLGSFKKQISLQLSDYFEKERPLNEKDNFTQQVNIANNDFIQLTIETGIIGIAFNICLVFIIISNIFGRSYNYCSVALICYMIMSFTNFIFYSVPCGYMLVLVLALNDSERNYTFVSFQKRIVFIFIGVLLSVTIYYTLRYESAIRQTNYLSKQNNPKYLNKLKPFQKILKSSDFYWLTVANKFYAAKSYQNAIKAAKKAINISYDYKAFSLLAEISNKTGSYEEEKYLKAVNKIVPGLFLPKYKLFEYYLRVRNEIEGKRMAKEIMEHKAKGIIDISIFKSHAKKYLENEN